MDVVLEERLKGRGEVGKQKRENRAETSFGRGVFLGLNTTGATGGRSRRIREKVVEFGKANRRRERKRERERCWCLEGEGGKML